MLRRSKNREKYISPWAAHIFRAGLNMNNMLTIDGNEAVANVAYRVSEVIAIYPITPSSGGFFLSCSLGRCRGAAKRRWQWLLTFIFI